MSEFMEGVFACAAIFVILGGLLIICHCIGLIIMRLRDLRTGKRRLCVLRRVL